MKQINCLVVDDEELARSLIVSYIDKLDFLTCLGTAENATEALSVIREQQVDLIFLDIQMPDIKGTDFARMLPTETKVIFTTAYSEYALEGFEINALDYLLKPITFQRFTSSVNRMKSSTNNRVSDTETITVKSGYDLHKIKYQDILFVVSDGEYVVFHTDKLKVMSHMSLKSLEQTLPKQLFMRVHRSYMINKVHITSLKGKDLLINEHVIPVSATYYDQVKEELF